MDSAIVVGGSSYNGSISVRDASNRVKATLDRSGVTAVGGSIGGWNIMENEISKNSVTLGADGTISSGTQWRLGNDGAGYFANGNLTWTTAGALTLTGTINATSGKIGGFDISYGRIGASASGSGSGGGLAIYNDFFRVGSSVSYAMFGDETIPASSGGFFTATSRITNNKANNDSYWGRTNCGIYFDVTGGTRNYGVYSNAALISPAMITTKIKTIRFGSGSYSIDFAQYNIFFIYATQSVNVTLPAETSVRSMFNYSTLPSDFACVFTMIYMYDKPFRATLTGIRNHNGDLQNYALEKGDSIVLLCAKSPNFHYQIINFSN